MTFSNFYSLKRHLVTHKSTKDYVCEICHRRFALPNYLKDHLNVHSGAKPYVCKYPGCGLKFRQASKLSIHKREHSNRLFRVWKMPKRDVKLASKNESNTLSGSYGPKKLMISIDLKEEFNFERNPFLTEELRI